MDPLHAARWRLAQAALSEPPPGWRRMLHAASRALASAGGGVVRVEGLTPDGAIQFVRLAAGGTHLDRGGDDPDATRGVRVPPEVAEAAWGGFASSYEADYAGDHFIGPARALQLALRERVPERTLARMSAYFSRHARDPKGPGSRSWLAWENWGGDPGLAWTRREMRLPRR